MRSMYVLETDSISNVIIPSNQIRRIFLANPFCFASLADMDGNGNALVVGIVSDADKRPWTVCGVEVSYPFIALGILRDNARYFEGGICVALKELVAAQIEDAIREMAWARSEDRECNCSFDIRGVLGKHVIVLLDHLGSGFSDGLKVEYKSNCIKLTYESWSVKALLMLMDRNAKTTPLHKMACMFEAGPPAFKWQLLPCDRVVVTFVLQDSN